MDEREIIAHISEGLSKALANLEEYEMEKLAEKIAEKVVKKLKQIGNEGG